MLYFHIPFFIFNYIIYEQYRNLAFEDPGYLEVTATDLIRIANDYKDGKPNRFCISCWVNIIFISILLKIKS